jgi:cystathionine gamma-synthase
MTPRHCTRADTTHEPCTAKSHDFIDQNARINDATARLARRLESHSDVVDKVHLSPNESVKYGVVLYLHHSCQRAFYAFDVLKGPSLGTNFTLVCPPTLVAHYH